MTLPELRSHALDLIRAEDWSGLLRLEPDLREDTEFWNHVWGPSVAVATGLLGRPDALARLAECADGGFHDLDILGAQHFEEAFGADPSWPALRTRITANVPAPRIELLRWPNARPTLPLWLARLDPAGEDRLATRLPERLPSARDTAEHLLHWVTSRWRHNGLNHDDSGDANHVLDRVEAGERFACLEYGVVLTQALNAVRIPARRISLYRADYHAGMGGAHAVTEAWIDDLGKWVLLDGQNGAVWRDADGTPLGVLELLARYRAGDQPHFDGTGPNFRAEHAAEWFRYFFAAGVKDGLAWSAGPYVPVYEGARVIECARLADSDADAAPDLAALSTGVIDKDGPALGFRADHPYAVGIEVAGPGGLVARLAMDEPLRLADEPGEYELTVAARTAYDVLTPQPLSYLVRLTRIPAGAIVRDEWLSGAGTVPRRNCNGALARREPGPPWPRRRDRATCPR